VTHDLDTTVSLSTRVAVLADQRVLICAPVEQVANVDHPFIREYFLGARGRRALEALPPERRATLCAAALAPVRLAYPPTPPGSGINPETRSTRSGIDDGK